MPRIILLLCVCMLLPRTVAGVNDDRASLRRPIALCLMDSGKTLLVANRDSGSVSIIDAARGEVVGEARFGRKLSSMTAHGPDVFLTDEDAGELIVLKYERRVLREVRRLKVGMTPVSVQIDTTGQRAAVACLWPRRLHLVSLVEPYESSEIDLPFSPRCQLIVPGTAKLVVADAFGGKLALIDLAHRKVDSVRSLHIHNIRALSLDQRGETLLLTHQVLYSQGTPNAGDIRSGNLIANQVRRLALASVLSPAADVLRDELVYTLGDVERGAGDPADVYESTDGSIIVCFAGVNELAIGRPERAIWTRLTVGARPTALAIDEPARRVYVASTFADAISVIDLATARVSGEITLGKTPPLTAAQRGELLFYDAQLSLEGWFSCHSCHSDGHTNGRLNDNFSDGSFGTPKRVLSLLGVKDTGPWAWNGRVAELETQVRSSLRSTMQGPAPATERVADLAAYLRTLPAPPSVPEARGIVNAAEVERGRRVFNDRQCALCHVPDAYTSPRNYDVGLRDEAGETQFNPPSLRGISQAGPYFHDNRAASLEELLVRFRHRLPEPLSQDELRDLLTFLQSR